jgi:hypothetical protein
LLTTISTTQRQRRPGSRNETTLRPRSARLAAQGRYQMDQEHGW